MLEQPVRESSGDQGHQRSLGILTVAAVIVGLVPLAMALRSPPNLFNSPIVEDAFYSLTVARNIATGSGFTIDGSVWTNGVQPLMTVVESVIFLGRPPVEVSIRLLIILSWLVMVSFASTLGFILRDLLAEREDGQARRFWFLATFVVAMSCQYVLAMSFNGLETGGQLLAFALVARYFQTHSLESRKEAAQLGGLLGLVVLVRIDAVVLCLTVVVWMAFIRRRHRSMADAFIVGLTAFVISSPWWIYNLVGFGNLVPISGRSESGLGVDVRRLEPMLTSIAKALTPWVYTSARVWIPLAALQTSVFLVIAIIGIRVWRSLDGSRWYMERKRNLGSFVVVLVANLAMLVIVYFLTSAASWFYWRYLAVASLITIGLSVLALKWLQERKPRLVSIIVLGLTAWSIVYPVGSFLHVGNDLQTDQVSLVRDHVPDGERVGSIQSGTLGFFQDRIVNLDGKVNPDALENRSRRGYYMRENAIDWFADWTVLFPMVLTGDPSIDDQWQLVAQSGNIGLWHFGALPE